MCSNLKNSFSRYTDRVCTTTKLAEIYALYCQSQEKIIFIRGNGKSCDAVGHQKKTMRFGIF